MTRKQLFLGPGRLLLALFVASLGLSACVTPESGTSSADDFGAQPFGDDDAPVTDDDDGPAPGAQTLLSGVVRDAFGTPLAGVTVTLPTGASVDSDADGKFVLEGLEPDPRALVNFVRSGYARTQTPIDLIEGAENTLLQTLAEVDYVNTFDASAGLPTFEIEPGGPTVDLPADNFVDSDGNLYSGEITVEATFYDLTSGVDEGNEIFAVPGDFTALDASNVDQQLESFGMFQVNLTGANGIELNLAGGTSSVVMPLQSLGLAPGEDTTLPFWSYDLVLGKWVEQAEGTIITLSDGTLAARFEAPHFSTWNLDRPVSQHGCLGGRVVDALGNPRSGASVRAVGLTYIATTTSRTGADGTFCLEVKNGETVWAEISYTIAGQTATQRTDPVTTGSQATCGITGTYSWNQNSSAAGCTDLGEIPVDIQTCVAGIVVDQQNVPQQGVQVVSPQGGVATTDAGGSFCLTVPVFQSTDVYVLTEQDQAGYTPVRVYSQPGLPGCQGGCSNVAVLRPYQSTSCAEGYAVVNGQVAGNLLVEVYDLGYPSVRVFSTLTNSDGSFCAALPVGTDVSVQIGSGDSVCAAQTVNTDGMGGQECSDVGQGQGAECYPLNDLACSL